MVFLKARAALPGLGSLWQILEHYTVNPDGTVSNDYETMPLSELIATIASLQGP